MLRLNGICAYRAHTTHYNADERTNLQIEFIYAQADRVGIDSIDNDVSSLRDVYVQLKFILIKHYNGAIYEYNFRRG